MKRTFPESVELARDTMMPGLATVRGERFGLFRFQSPKTGATLRVIACAWEEAEKDRTSGIPGAPPEDWDHVSVSVMNRTPTWDEMCYVKDLFFDIDECVVQYHPPKCDYINCHPYVLHMWKPHEVKLPMPPKECI